MAKSLESEKKQGNQRMHYLSTYIGVESSTAPYNTAQPNLASSSLNPLTKKPNHQNTLRDKVKTSAGVRSDDGTGPEKAICVMGSSGELSLSGSMIPTQLITHQSVSVKLVTLCALTSPLYLTLNASENAVTQHFAVALWLSHPPPAAW